MTVDRLVKRTSRVRRNIRKFSDRIRLTVFKSNQHIYAQLIDDTKALTLASASTMDKEYVALKDEMKLKGKSNCNKESAKIVGKLIAGRGTDQGVNEVVFDKGGNKYHGVVMALADAAREKLNF